MEIKHIEPRPCGECRACCTSVGVVELEKANYQQCQHECPTGCAIYDQRPDSCRGYYCGWAGRWVEGDERRRPDNLGVIFDFNIAQDDLGNLVEIIRAWEVWPGASRESKARYAIQRLEQEYGVPIVVVDEELGRSSWGAKPPDDYEEKVKDLYQRVREKMA